ncbi:MAG: ATPase, T2SS/T4P/T4SS family, partial [Candidatus Margulisiibacteriota bacterium]
LIGEMRELDTISTAVTAAETGHLVISTLHTNDAVQTIDRIVDIFPSHQQNQIRIQLSMTLQGVISQQLIPRADGMGLIVAAEILKVNSAVRNIMRKGSTQEIYSMMEIGVKQGMQTMDMALRDLYKEGLIKYEDALARAVNEENLEKMLVK